MDARRCPQHSQRRHPLHEHRHTLPPSLSLEMSLSHPRPVSLSLPFEKFDPLAAWPMMASTPVTARWARRVRCGGQAARAAGPARGPGWGRVRSGGAGRELEAGGWGLDQSPAAAAPLPPPSLSLSLSLSPPLSASLPSSLPSSLPLSRERERERDRERESEREGEREGERERGRGRGRGRGREREGERALRERWGGQVAAATWVLQQANRQAPGPPGTPPPLSLLQQALLRLRLRLARNKDHCT